MAQSDAQETPKSALRASDLNLMTERGEEEHDKPKQETPHSIFLPARNPVRDFFELDPLLRGLPEGEKPEDTHDALTDALLSVNGAGG